VGSVGVLEGESDLSFACTDKINDDFLQHTNSESEFGDLDSKQNLELVEFVLNNIEVGEDGRICVPALWNERVKHLLPKNYKLASSILKSVIKKYSNNSEKLSQYNDSINKWIEQGVVEKVDLNLITNNTDASFLAHNAVFRPDALSTKCRVVLLANLCERISEDSLSHNQISLPGPQLNSKISTICTLYRFNKYLLVYDLKMAFLQLKLRGQDSDKLHILWFEDVTSENFTEIALRFLRVPFGLRFSPFLLMISLYFMLILDAKDDAFVQLRNMLYNLAYMDNIAYSSSNPEEIIDSYHRSNKIFNAYCFELQQFDTNLVELREIINGSSFDSADSSVKLFGMIWDTKFDSFKPKAGFLDPKANTRREILSSLNSNYDPLGVYLPNLNRAKLFLHDLVLSDELLWDTPIGSDDRKSWKNICSQLNNSNNKPELTRYIGEYTSSYNLIACTDASKHFYGACIYIYDLNTGSVSFLMARNKLVTKSLARKSIPILELIALVFGVECLQEIRKDLCGAFVPVDVQELHLYSDSMISLCWLHSKSHKFDKIERKSVIINNQLDIPLYFITLTASKIRQMR